MGNIIFATIVGLLLILSRKKLAWFFTDQLWRSFFSRWFFGEHEKDAFYEKRIKYISILCLLGGCSFLVLAFIEFIIYLFW